MPRILDFGQDVVVMNDALDMVEQQGYSAEEAIPGLILAVRVLSDQCGNDGEQALDEAMNLLVDGPVEEDIIK